MKKALERIGIAVVGLIVLLVAIVLVLSTSTTFRLNKTYSIQPENVSIPTDQAALDEGKRLVSIYCTSCHGEDLGGTDFFNDPALAVVDASNLTPGEGGVGSRYGDVDWTLAIRHGVDPDGKPLFIMPSKDFYNFSDDDLGQIIAYLKTIPPVDNDAKDFSIGVIGQVLLAVGAFGDVLNAEIIPHEASRPRAPEVGVSADYGKYLADTFGCRTCHGSELSGGKDPDPAAPLAPNLTPGGQLGSWSEQIFLDMVRSRKSEWMPFESLSNMSDDELKAIWQYLKSLPSLDTTTK